MASQVPHTLSLVVLFDGTSNSHFDQNSSYPSNVFKTFHCLKGRPIHCLSQRLTKKLKILDPQDPNGNEKVFQRALYIPGIGTLEESSIQSTASVLQGAGLIERVVRAYVWLSLRFRPKPNRPPHQVEISLVGFSRGGYAVRLLAEFICHVGLLLPNAVPPPGELTPVRLARKRIHYELSLLLLMRFLVVTQKQRILRNEIAVAATSEYVLRPEERGKLSDATETEQVQLGLMAWFMNGFQKIPRRLQEFFSSSPPLSTSIFKNNFKILSEWKEDNLEAQIQRISEELLFSKTLLTESFQLIPFPIKALAVWDTVGAIGRSLLDTVIRSPVEDEQGVVYPLQYCPMQPHANIQSAFHAVAIDEYRPEFAVVLMQPNQNASITQQVFFPGSHADVGGGYPFLSVPDDEEVDDIHSIGRALTLQDSHKRMNASYRQLLKTHHESGLSDVALCWMIDKLSGIVHFQDDISKFSKRTELALQQTPPDLDGLWIRIKPDYKFHESVSQKFWQQSILVKPSPFAVAHCEQFGGMSLSPRLFPKTAQSHKCLHPSFKLRSVAADESFVIHIKRNRLVTGDSFSLKLSPNRGTYYHTYPRITASL